MSGRLFSEVSFTVSGLMDQVALGQIALPDLQRPFVWPNTKVRDLFDSMYRGYPVGYLLFWENGAVKGSSGIGSDRKQLPPRLLVIDGQQRLTSLYAVLRGQTIKRQDFSEETIQIAFRPTDGAFEVPDAAIRKDPAWLADISLLWNKKTDLFALAGEYLSRLGVTREVSSDERRAIQQAIMRLQQLDGFPFTALALSSDLDEEQVADVFVRINSKGTPLNQADFILTLMSVFHDRQRADLETFCRKARMPPASGPSPFNYFLEPEPDHLLRVAVGLGFRRARLKHVYSILRGKDLDSGEFSAERREEQFRVLDAAQSYTLDLQHWQDFLQCLVRAGFRSSAMVSSKNALLYTYVFYLIGRRDFRIALPKLRDAIARWFFFVSLTGRYTDSSETRMEQDLADLREVTGGDAFLRQLDAILAANLTRDYWALTLPAELATSSARSPTLFAYYAALHRLGARAFFSPMQVRELLDPTVQGKRSALERHHLFPKAYLQKKGVESHRETNQIANYAVVEWADNAAIGERAPRDYFPEFTRRAGTAEELRSMCFWHALPDGWEAMDYPRFLEARRPLLARVIQAGFETLSPAPAFSGPGLLVEAALDRACLLLPGRLAADLRERHAESLVEPESLRAEVQAYLERLATLAVEEPRFDLDFARRLGERCLRLLAREDRPEEEARLAQAAVSYFTTEDDLDPDLASGEGFRDDATLLSAVERALSEEAQG